MSSLVVRIVMANNRLRSTPLKYRGETWCAAKGGVDYAMELLQAGRKAKAGKVFQAAHVLVEEAAP